jgi:hypothetical protein
MSKLGYIRVGVFEVRYIRVTVTARAPNSLNKVPLTYVGLRIIESFEELRF